MYNLLSLYLHKFYFTFYTVDISTQYIACNLLQIIVLNYKHNCVFSHDNKASIGCYKGACGCSGTYLAVDHNCNVGNTTYDMLYPSSRNSNHKLLNNIYSLGLLSSVTWKWVQNVEVKGFNFGVLYRSVCNIPNGNKYITKSTK